MTLVSSCLLVCKITGVPSSERRGWWWAAGWRWVYCLPATRVTWRHQDGENHRILLHMIMQAQKTWLAFEKVCCFAYGFPFFPFFPVTLQRLCGLFIIYLVGSSKFPSSHKAEITCRSVDVLPWLSSWHSTVGWWCVSAWHNSQGPQKQREIPPSPWKNVPAMVAAPRIISWF